MLRSIFRTSNAILLLTVLALSFPLAADTTTEPLAQYGCGPLTCMDISPDGTKMLTASGHTCLIYLWDLPSKRVIRRLSGHLWYVLDVAFSSDGTKAVSAAGRHADSFGIHDGEAKLWDLATGACLQTFNSHDDLVISVAISPDGSKVLTGSFDHTAKLWDAATGACLFTFIDCIGLDNTAVDFSYDGTKAITASGNLLNVWDTGTGANLLSVTFNGELGDLVALPDEYTALAIVSGEVKFYDLETGAARETLLSGYGAPLTISTDGARALAVRSFQAVLMDLQTESLIQTYIWPRVPLSLAFSPDGANVYTAIGEDMQMVKQWDTETGDCLRNYYGHMVRLTSTAFSPDGNYLATGSNENYGFYYDNAARLFDIRTGECLRPFEGHTNAVLCVDFSADGTQLLTGSIDWTARFWDVQTGTQLRSVTIDPGTNSSITSIAVFAGGARAMTGTNTPNQEAYLWDLDAGALLQTFTGHTTYVTAVALSHDETLALTGAHDNTAILWDATTGGQIRQFTGFPYDVLSVAFSPDDTKILIETGADLIIPL